MARPKKQTVDYFPHDTDASHRKTLTIIQSKYGNDGYAFWYKLLELLGRTPGHCYSYQNAEDLEFLCAETHQKDTETVLGILATLDILSAIDHELYDSKIIWCQKFVNGVEDAYTRSKDGVPMRPCQNGVNVTETRESVNILQTETQPNGTETPANVTETPQTKLNYTKLNKRENKNSNVFLLYEQEIGKLTQTISVQLTELQDEYPYSEIAKAVKIAVMNNKRSLAYIKGILKKVGKTDAPASILEGLED